MSLISFYQGKTVRQPRVLLLDHDPDGPLADVDEEDEEAADHVGAADDAQGQLKSNRISQYTVYSKTRLCPQVVQIKICQILPLPKNGQKSPELILG